MARELLRGHLPYATVWETKPPLLFALLALAFLAFGTSTLALRFATDVAIVATALALYAIGTTLRRDGRAVGTTAALFYAALTLSDGASSALAETFYAPFVAIPIACVLARRRAGRAAGPGTSLALGASLGCAVLVKESAALEAIFAAAVVVRTTGVRSAWTLGAGFVAALGASVAPYAVAHSLAAYWDANVGAVARRAFVRVTDATPPFDIVRAQAFAFFPASLLAFGLPWLFGSDVAASDERNLARLCAVWALVDLLTVAAIREFLGNHFIPVMAPAALIAALVAVRFALRRGWRWFVPALWLVALLAHCGYQFVLAAPVAYHRVADNDATFGDPTAGLAAYLRAHATPTTTLYVADDRAVLYVLAGFSPPTRYAYAPHLVDAYQETVAGVDGRAEVERIFDGRPTFVVRDLAARAHEDPRVREAIDRRLARNYRPVFSIGARTIYRRDGKT